MHPVPVFVVFLGALLVLAWWIACRPEARTTSGPDQADFWTTPLYLRNNTAIFDGTVAVTPSFPDNPWALATYYGV